MTLSLTPTHYLYVDVAVKGIAVDEATDANEADMSTYAVDISLEGGASALARVMREDKRNRVDDGATTAQRARL